MASVESEAKGALKSVKQYWPAFLVVGVLLVAWALRYDRKNNGALTSKLAKAPLIGGWFSA